MSMFSNPDPISWSSCSAVVLSKWGQVAWIAGRNARFSSTVKPLNQSLTYLLSVDQGVSAAKYFGQPLVLVQPAHRNQRKRSRIVEIDWKEYPKNAQYVLLIGNAVIGAAGSVKAALTVSLQQGGFYSTEHPYYLNTCVTNTEAQHIITDTSAGGIHTTSNGNNIQYNESGSPLKNYTPNAESTAF